MHGFRGVAPLPARAVDADRNSVRFPPFTVAALSRSRGARRLAETALQDLRA